MNDEEETQVKEIITERVKWMHFFEIARRKYIWIPILMLILYLYFDDPKMNIFTLITRYFTRLAGVQ